jgi:hypothetical protein
MKQFFTSLLVLASLSSYSQTSSESVITKEDITIGSLSGIGALYSQKNNMSANTFSYGAYLNTKKIGIEFMYGAGLTNNDATDYIYGRAKNYTAGYTVNMFGAYYIVDANQNSSIHLGLGCQNVTSISTDMIETLSSPYGIFGGTLNIGKTEMFEIKGEVHVGLISSLNVGFGIRL